MNNTNLHPIPHRFQVIADYWSNLRFRQGVTRDEPRRHIRRICAHTTLTFHL